MDSSAPTERFVVYKTVYSIFMGMHLVQIKL